MAAAPHNAPALEKAIATIGDPDLAARYPDRTHFISASNPDQGEMATRALLAGDPVVIVQADGREVLIRAERAGGLPSGRPVGESPSA